MSHRSGAASRAYFSRLAITVRQLATLLLIGAVLLMSVSPAAASSVTSSTVGQTTAWASALPGLWQLWESAKGFFGAAQLPQLPTEQQPRPQLFPPEPPRTRPEREVRVRRLDLNVPRLVMLRSGQQTAFSAVAVDDDGQAIQGLPVRWESSDESVIFIRPNGQARAGNAGRAHIKARAGNRLELVQVIVLAAALPLTVPSPPPQTLSRTEKTRADGLKNNGAASNQLSAQLAHGARLPGARPQQDPPNLPQGEVSSLYEPRNAVGNPPNRYFPSAQTPPAANRSGREMPGSDNYSFSVPVTSLPGRGIDVSLALNYNSSLWHKSGANNNRLTFNVDGGWPVPGFRLGYGSIGSQNGGTLKLVDPDGTRHELLNDAPYWQLPSYTTNDGTFIRVNGLPGFPTATYTDGTQIYYGATSTNGTNVTYYPTRVTERHGNYITINYQTDANGNQVGPRISYIQDTLGRMVRFYYDGNNNLVTITVPGYANGGERQEVRFYYDTISDFTNSAKFTSNLTIVNRPASLQVIRYLYFPGTQQGYRYDYSPYGMIRQITQLRGMTVSPTPSPQPTNQTGQVVSDGQVAATTVYGYPATTPLGGLSAAPTYNSRTDDWAGNTAGAATTLFNVGEESTKITAPDGSYSETTSDGTTDTTEVKRPTQPPPPPNQPTVYARTRIEWELDANSQNRRVHRVQTTTDPDLATGKTKTIEYTYTDYNNPDEVIEYDFNTAPNTPGPILRRTKTTYVTDAAYTSRGLVRLPASVKVFAGTSNVPHSWVNYAYDEGVLVGYPHPAGQDFITNYDETYDPSAPPEVVWDYWLNDPNCELGPPHPPSNNCPCCPATWGPRDVPVYDPATARRGDLTSVMAYADADASTPTQAITDTMAYDITGNVITETANCCQQRSYTYTTGYQYAYPETVTSGTGATQLIKSAVYDYNTGALRTSTDENNQTTTLHYDPANLRLYETVKPDGGTTDIIYFADQLFADPDAAHLHSAVMTVTSLDANRTVRSWQFSDGRGNVARSFGENGGQGHTGASYVEYDVMGRLKRASNPYYAVYGAGTDVNPTGLWTTYAYDYLGRPTTTTLQDGNTVRSDYAGVVTTWTDQAGKQRRQTVDALGRIIQLDEPDATGALTQSTTYRYDSLDNLIKITQGAEQQRYFKYDSLSRLTFERQVEQDAPHAQPDTLTGNNYWSHKIIYNADNLVTDSWDARGIQTHVTYDGLNRVSQITYAGEPSSTTTPTMTYTYDEQRAGYFNRGRLTTVTTAAGGGTLTPVPQTIQVLDYDRMGRVKRKRQTTGAATYTIGYSYNLLGELQSETYPSGRVVSTSYDAAARLSSVSDGGQSYANSFAYAGFGGLTSETWGNGAVHTMAYNERLQLKQLKLTVGGVEKQRYDYRYGEVNGNYATLNILPGYGLDTSKNTGQVAVIEGSIDGVRQWQQRLAYDKLGRLSTARELTDNQTQAGAQAWRVDYTYDRWGNRYQQAGQGNVPVADGDLDKSRNRFRTVGATQMIYDAAGNLTIDQKFRGMQFTYDTDGRMRRTDATNGYTLSTYDSEGQRVQYIDSLTNVTRQTVFDAAGRAIADYENGVWKRDYIYRSDEAVLLATVEPTRDTKYVLPDHQGSTRVVTNQSGQIIERHDYKPFGEDIGAGTGLRTTTQGYSVSNPIRQQYALTERDSISIGLNHTGFRKLDSSAGKWTSPDPYRGSISPGDPQSMNRYAYAGNDPINSIDPDGLFWVLIGCKTPSWWNGEAWDHATYEICTYDWINTSQDDDDFNYKFEALKEKREREKLLDECLKQSLEQQHQEALAAGPPHKLSEILPSKTDILTSGIGGGLNAYGKLKIGASAGAAVASGGRSILGGLALSMGVKFVVNGVSNIARAYKLESARDQRDRDCKEKYGRPKTK